MNTTQKELKQFTDVYHTTYGKGHIVSIQFRFRDRLIMCYFPKVKEHEWITEKELFMGTGDVTLTPIDKMAVVDNVPDSLQSALESLFTMPKR